LVGLDLKVYYFPVHLRALDRALYQIQDQPLIICFDDTHLKSVDVVRDDYFIQISKLMSRINYLLDVAIKHK